MATATNYVINAKELPANQIAAALFNQAVIVSVAGDVGTPREWSSSPLGGGGAGISSFGDVPSTGAVSRTSCSLISLGTEQARIQARQDTVNRDISIITTTP